MSESFKVLAIIANHEREVLQTDTQRKACETSLKKNKKTCGTVYIVERPDGSRMTINEQRMYLRDEEDYERKNDPLLKDEYYNDHPKKLRGVTGL